MSKSCNKFVAPPFCVIHSSHCLHSCGRWYKPLTSNSRNSQPSINNSDKCPRMSLLLCRLLRLWHRPIPRTPCQHSRLSLLTSHLHNQHSLPRRFRPNILVPRLVSPFRTITLLTLNPDFRKSLQTRCRFLLHPAVPSLEHRQPQHLSGPRILRISSILC